MKKKNLIDKIKKKHLFGEKPVKTIILIDLMGKGFTVRDKTYIPTLVEIFEKKIVIDFNVGTDINDGLKSETITAQFSKELRLTPLEINGRIVFWDCVDEVFRWVPEEPALECDYINKWITVWDNGEMRVEKEYAEHNLSEKAIEYAFFCGEEYYSWNMDDYSYPPVLYELSSQFKKFMGSESLVDPKFYSVMNYVSFYTSDFCGYLGCNTPQEHFEKYLTFYRKKLWEPEN